jgi:hypothetical protein
MKISKKFAALTCTLLLVTCVAQPVAQAGFDIGGIIGAVTQGKKPSPAEAVTGSKEPKIITKEGMGYSANGPDVLYGHVYYQNGQPGANVKVMIGAENLEIYRNECRNGAYYVTTADGNGNFRIPVKRGLYSVVAWTGRFIGRENHYSEYDKGTDIKLEEKDQDIVFDH